MKSEKGVQMGIIFSTAIGIETLGGIIEIQATKNIGEGFGILASVGLIALSVAFFGNVL
jgi:hypothetical protein